MDFKRSVHYKVVLMCLLLGNTLLLLCFLSFVLLSVYFKPSQFIVWLGIGAFSLFVLCSILILYRTVFKPLHRLKNVLEKISAGDLSQSPNIPSSDEFGEIANILTQIIQQIKTIPQQTPQPENTPDARAELERMNQLMIGRELKMVEFKRALKELRAQSGTDQTHLVPEGKIELNRSFTFAETQQAMLNLLEDERALEEQLKIEKTSVEKKVVERTRELNDEKIKLEASINSLSVGFIMVDRGHNIITINQTARLSFCSSSTSPLATVQECTITHIEDELKGSLDLKGLINRCFSEKRALMLREVSHQNRYFKIFVTPIITIGVIGAVILIDDITEAKIMERSKDEFFSIASHELRTPLTAIKGNTSLMKEYYTDKLNDPELKEMIKDIHESSVRLIGIVNDFLDMSRLEQGRMEFKKEPLAITELINETLKEYQPTSSQKNVALTFTKPSSSLPHIYADKNKVKQILINLLGNALKFTERGSITLSTEVVGNFLKIFVTDTGRGIPLANQNLLFRKFQQANTSLLTRDTTKGTGLGLYISKLIAEGMGGTIKLENSLEGKGTTFSFSLPIATQQQLMQTKPQTTMKTNTATGITQQVS